MEYHLKSNKDKEPTLAEMTEFAISSLKRDPNGFFLFVEGK
jgi:alkaline phosphatase